MSEGRQVELTPDEEKENSKAVLAHVLPFAIWLTMMVWFDDYNARTFGGLLVLGIFRPWRWYPAFNLKHLPVALGVGVFIFIVWVGLETPWVVKHASTVNEWYDRLLVEPMKPFKMRELFDSGGGVMVPYEVIEGGEHKGLHVYNPKVTGWLSFWIHMFGTAVVIAIIEEYFYRGFAYRWMQGSPFYKLDAGHLNWPMLLLVSAFFAVTHYEIGAAVICGICYGLLYVKTRDIWAAIIAHGTTNFLLGLYVVKYNAYQLW